MDKITQNTKWAQVWIWTLFIYVEREGERLSKVETLVTLNFNF